MKRRLVGLALSLCACGSSSTPKTVDKVVALTSASPVSVTLRKPESGVALANDVTLHVGTTEDLTLAPSTRVRAGILAGLSDADRFDDLVTLDVEASIAPQAGAKVILSNPDNDATCEATFGSSLFATVPSTCVPELMAGAALLTSASYPLQLDTDASSMAVSLRLNPGSPEGYADFVQHAVVMPAGATFTSLSGTIRAEPAASLTQTVEIVVILIVDLNGDGIATLDERHAKVIEPKKDIALATWLDAAFAKKAVAANAGKTLTWTFVGAVRGTTNLPNLDSVNVVLSVDAKATVSAP